MAAPTLRRGLLVLAAAGLVYTAAIVIRGPMPDPATQAGAFARFLVGPYTRFAWAAILGGGVLELIGLVALYAAIARSGPSTSALGGWLLSTVGMAMALPIFGFLAMAGPRIGSLYIQGDTQVMSIATAFFGGTRMTVALLAIMTITYIVGCILTAVAAWRRTAAPKWAIVAFVLHAPLICIPVPFPLEIAGGALLLAAAVGFLSLASDPTPAAPAAASARESAMAGV
ncbi:MAG TPA: hypothetical protein VFH27_15995 [Longimicrobiaceae bacterium]|nr:hypothetical protein [Longimicrobiaceae bacterium]